MAHLRKRFLETLIRKACTWSPAVALLGMRQAGKTTLLRGLSDGFYSFDDISVVQRFESERTSLLEQGPFPLCLDEVQKFPPLFDALKHSIDLKKTPGRYLLTGSVRFSSRKTIRESMTGRVVLFELYPLSLAECHNVRATSFLAPFEKIRNQPQKILSLLEKRSWAKESDVDHYIETGGLPGICFKRDKTIRAQLFNSQLDTLLGRDIHLVCEIRLSISQLKELFRLVCLEQGLPLNFSRLAKQIGVSAPTVKKALDAMEGIFLIRKHGKVFYSEDLGLSSYACRSNPLSARANLLRFLYRELKTNLDYCNPLEADLGEYSTPGGIDLPLVIHTESKLKIAIAADAQLSTSEKSLKSLTYFRKAYPESLALAVHMGEMPYISSTGVICIPRSMIP